MTRLVVVSASVFASGLVFAVGLAVSGMTRPEKVIGFLDIGGSWDPSLALVMVGAIAVYAVAHRLSLRMSSPVLAESFPRFGRAGHARIDRQLVVGSVLFGSGWGLAGYCPGPALATLGSGSAAAALFVAAMLGGMWVTRMVVPPHARRQAHRQRETGPRGLPEGVVGH